MGSKNGNDNNYSTDADVQKGTPISLGTLELLCDEKNVLLAPDASSGWIRNNVSKTEIYAQQEKLVLMKFRDCLNRLITRGKIKANGTNEILVLKEQKEFSLVFAQERYPNL
ncbi:hypothetical protein U1Q18_006597 [Sarracenia purpurea var. burkii]